MTKRERFYHWRKSKHGKSFIERSNKIRDSFWTIGAAGSHVGLDENGNVFARILSIDECLDILEKERNGELIPENYTIVKSQ